MNVRFQDSEGELKFVREVKQQDDGRYLMCCIFHDEKTPSFVYDDKFRYHCYGCGKHGVLDVFPSIDESEIE